MKSDKLAKQALESDNFPLDDIDDDECRQKRILLNLPTGAGKTRMTVQALIEWLNLRALGKCENAHPQQQNPRGLIFWLASIMERKI